MLVTRRCHRGKIQGRLRPDRDGCWTGIWSLTKNAKSTFDPNVFLAEVDGGRTISNYGKGQIIFTQVTRRIQYSSSKAGE
jgi:hypothetical protein